MEPTSGSLFDHSDGQELGKFIIDDTDGAPESPVATLPGTYGDNRLVVMARDPRWFFAYWDATADRFDALRQQVGDATWQRGTSVLRAYDVTGVEGDITKAHRFFDTSVTFDARRWYVNVPEAGRNWIAELGFIFPDGRFLALLRSNRIGLPQGVVSSQTDSKWMVVNVKEWEKMFETTPVSPQQTGSGSAEIAKMMAQRWEFLRSVFSGSSSQLSGSSNLHGPAKSPDESKS